MRTPSLIRTLSTILGLAALGALLAYQTGLFNGGRIKPSTTPLPPSTLTPQTTLTLEPRVLPLCYTGVGTITPRTTADIAAQVTAKILSVKVRPGDRVRQGDTLVILDNRSFKSRMDQARQDLAAAEAMRSQARQAIKAAQARFDQTRSRYKRMQEMFASRAISSQDLEVAQADFLQAQAGLEQAKQGLEAARAQRNRSQKMLEEATINLGYTTIQAPMDGDVARRLVDPGDLAVPGQPLLTIHAGEQLRIEAVVREGLMGKVSLGQRVPVDIASINKTVTGIIEEIVPTADPRTRTFMVKASLPEMPGIYPGMFGR
jgi:multidrug resistance efflux pump